MQHCVKMGSGGEVLLSVFSCTKGERRIVCGKMLVSLGYHDAESGAGNDAVMFFLKSESDT